jgi:hypothetical protein
MSVVGSHWAPIAAEHTAHVPVPPHAPGAVPLMQALPEQQNPPLHVPSPPAPHAEVHAPAVHVGVPAPQTAQAAPFEPQAPFATPETHVPAVPQQPVLHAFPGPQLLEQRCDVVLQVSSAGQSVTALQPQVPPVSQTWPLAELVQSEQATPPVPHALAAAPPTHAPPEQHPPLHPVVPLLQAVEQVWLVVLQACPEGQSPGALQPQTPVARQAWPALSPLQSAHTVPFAPHWATIVPG